MASARNVLCALGTALFLGANVAAVPLDVGIDLDICIPFGIEVGLFVDLYSPPLVTECVPFFTTSTTSIPSAGVYTIPSGISTHKYTATGPTELCVTSVTTKTTTYPCSTSTSFPTTWWDPCKGASTSTTCRWTPPATTTTPAVTTTATTTVTTTITESAPCSTSTPQPTLSCDPYGYLIQVATLYRVDLTTGATTKVATAIGANTSINAIGYNTLDNYIYGFQTGTNTIVKISADGTTVNVKGAAVPFDGDNVGDFDLNGHYWVSSMGKAWAEIDLAPGSSTYGQVLAQGNTSDLGYAIADWVYMPVSGEYLWSIAIDTSNMHSILLRFDLSTHSWEKVVDYGNLGVNTWGALYGINNGTLYGSGNNNGQIWQFPTSGSKPFKVSQGPPSGQNDGARCVLNLLAH